MIYIIYILILINIDDWQPPVAMQELDGKIFKIHSASKANLTITGASVG